MTQSASAYMLPWEWHLKLKVARQASNKSKESKDADEKELEAISTKSKGKLFSDNISTDCGLIGRTFGRSGQKGRNSLALFALKFRQTIIKGEFTGKLGLTSLGGSSVERWITLDLKGWISKAWDGKVSGRFLVSTSRNTGKWLPVLGLSLVRRVSKAFWSRTLRNLNDEMEKSMRSKDNPMSFALLTTITMKDMWYI